MEAWADLADDQLATLAQNGRTDAYGELVRRYQNRVFNVAYRLLGERQEALDMTQEAFVRAYSAFNSFDPARPFGPWMSRIVTNLALNAIQKRRVPTVSLIREPSFAGAEPREWLPPDPAADPEQVYLASEREALLRSALLELPPHYRAVIELRHFQELSYEAIAETLAIPLSDVKSHLFRARQYLRKHLENSQ